MRGSFASRSDPSTDPLRDSVDHAPMSASHDVIVLVDSQEPPAVASALEELGAGVVVLRLPVGDHEIAEHVLVERKAVNDLHDSVVRGRFWRQVGLLRAGCASPYLLIEGRSLDAGPLTKAAVRGICVAAIDLGVRLIRTEDTVDSAQWLVRARCSPPAAAPTRRARLCSAAKTRVRARRGDTRIHPRRLGQGRTVAPFAFRHGRRRGGRDAGTADRSAWNRPGAGRSNPANVPQPT
jgi:hypothetical protein